MRHAYSILAATLATLASGTKPVSVPATWVDDGYLLNMTVGTPPQELLVMSDWSWISLFIRSGRCLDQYDVALCVPNGQPFFNELASDTFRNASSLPQLAWTQTAFAPDFTVDYATDTICWGDACVPDTIMEISDLPYNGSVVPAQPFAGILGLAPVTPAVNETFYTPTYQAWKAGIIGPRVGFHVCDVLSSSETCLGGDAKYVLGGVDESMFDPAALRTYRIKNPKWISDAFWPYEPPKYNYWAAPVTGVWIRESRCHHSPNFAVPFHTNTTKRAERAEPAEPAESTEHAEHVEFPLGVLDEGSHGLGLPLSVNAYAWLVSKVGATLASAATVQSIAAQGSSGPYADSQDWYTVPCNGQDTKHFPSLVYELDGQANYTALPEDYVTPLTQTGQEGLCYLNTIVWPTGQLESGDAMIYTLGVDFLKRSYVVFNQQDLTFGLAPLKLN